MDGWRPGSRHRPQSRVTVQAVLSFPRDTPEPLELSALPSDTGGDSEFQPTPVLSSPQTFIQTPKADRQAHRTPHGAIEETEAQRLEVTYGKSCALEWPDSKPHLLLCPRVSLLDIFVVSSFNTWGRVVRKHTVSRLQGCEWGSG